MKIHNKGRTVIAGAVVAAIVTQAAAAAALVCKVPWQTGFFTCSDTLGALRADGSAQNINQPNFNREVAVQLSKGRGAQAGAIDANGVVIAACTTAEHRDTVGATFETKGCFTGVPPAQLMVVVR